MRFLKLIFVKLLFFNSLVLSQTNETLLLKKILYLDEVQTVFSPLNELNYSKYYFGDSTHIMILKNHYTFDSLFQIGSRTVCIVDSSDYRFKESRVHLIVDTIINHGNRTEVRIYSRLTNGVLIRQKDFKNEKLLHDSWLLEQKCTVEIVIIFKKNSKIKSVKKKFLSCHKCIG